MPISCTVGIEGPDALSYVWSPTKIQGHSDPGLAATPSPSTCETCGEAKQPPSPPSSRDNGKWIDHGLTSRHTAAAEPSPVGTLGLNTSETKASAGVPVHTASHLNLHHNRVRSPAYFRTQYLNNLGIWAHNKKQALAQSPNHSPRPGFSARKHLEPNAKVSGPLTPLEDTHPTCLETGRVQSQSPTQPPSPTSEDADEPSCVLSFGARAGVDDAWDGQTEEQQEGVGLRGTGAGSGESAQPHVQHKCGGPAATRVLVTGAEVGREHSDSGSGSDGVGDEVARGVAAGAGGAGKAAGGVAVTVAAAGGPAKMVPRLVRPPRRDVRRDYLSNLGIVGPAAGGAGGAAAGGEAPHRPPVLLRRPSYGDLGPFMAAEKLKDPPEDGITFEALVKVLGSLVGADRLRTHSQEQLPSWCEACERKAAAAGGPELVSPCHHKHVQFCGSVAAVYIPLHSEFSTRVRRSYWSSAGEIREMVYRNMIEFEAEGMDWQRVCEEEDMYYCEETGEFIHPIFFDEHEQAQEATDDDHSLEGHLEFVNEGRRLPVLGNT